MFKLDLVTCVAIDYTGSLIVTGSMDTTCMIWQVVQEFGLSVNLDPVPMHILYGHTESVTSVDISNELDIVASASLDGTVNMHTIRTGSFIRRLSFLDEKISIFKNLTLKLSNERHLLVYVSSLPFENPTQMTCSEQTKV
jgi:WD40 repeat protein